MNINKRTPYVTHHINIPERIEFFYSPFLFLAYHNPFQVARSMGWLSHKEAIFWWSLPCGMYDYTFSISGITGQTRFILERGDLFDTLVFALYSNHCYRRIVAGNLLLVRSSFSCARISKQVCNLYWPSTATCGCTEFRSVRS